MYFSLQPSVVGFSESLAALPPINTKIVVTALGAS